MSKVQDKLPSGWAEATIEDIFETLEDGRTLHQGWSPQCESFPSQDEKVWGALRTTAIQAGRFCPGHNKQLPAHLAPRPVIEVKAGDILLTCAGPRSRCGIACLVRNTRKRLMISGKMYRFRVPEKEIDARYVEAYLQTTAAQMAIDAMKTGGSDSGLNLTHERFRPLRIPIAPRNEQQRIADTLDELLSDLDAGGDALHSAKAKLALYRASVLKAAVQGDLTAEWRKQHPDAEPATELLKRILKERRQRWEQEQLRKFADASKTPPANWKAKYKEPITPDKTNLPKLPKDWCWVSLDALLREQLRNGHSSKATLSGDGVPTFTLSAVTYGDFSDSNIKFTSANPAKVTDLWVQPDDIFIERSNTRSVAAILRRWFPSHPQAS